MHSKKFNWLFNWWCQYASFIYWQLDTACADINLFVASCFPLIKGLEQGRVIIGYYYWTICSLNDDLCLLYLWGLIGDFLCPSDRIHVVDCLPNVWMLDGRLVTCKRQFNCSSFLMSICCCSSVVMWLFLWGIAACGSSSTCVRWWIHVFFQQTWCSVKHTQA